MIDIIDIIMVDVGMLAQDSGSEGSTFHSPTRGDARHGSLRCTAADVARRASKPWSKTPFKGIVWEFPNIRDPV